MKNFNLFDLRTPSNLNKETLTKMLRGTLLETLVDSFLEAETREHVNTLFLCAYAIWESAWGTSHIARNKYNLFHVYEETRFPYKTMVRYKSYDECIQRVAHQLHVNYLDPEGSHYCGPNLHGLRVTLGKGEEVWEQGVNLTMNLLLLRA